MSRVFSTGGGFMFDSDGNRVNMADLTRQIAQAQSNPQAAADAGAIFIAGGRETLSSGDVFSLVGENPAGSGFRIRAFLITAYTGDSDSLQVSFIINPAVGTATSRPAINFNVSDTTTQAILQVSSGVNNLTGGQESSIAAEVSRSNSFRFSGPPSLVIDPGDRLAMTITAPGGLTGSGRAAGNVAWVIEPLA